MRNPSLPSPTPPRALAWGERASAVLLAVALSLAAGSAQAQPKSNDPPKLRFAQDLRGDFALIGNTLAQDCRVTTPRPIIGRMPPVSTTVPGDAACYKRDTSPDFFWTLNDWTIDSTGATTQPAAPITATGINPLSARSQAMLSLPAGATVVYARLYWAATRSLGVNDGNPRQPDLTAQLSRPGVAGFDKAIVADDYAFEGSTSEYQYQSTADITDIVRQYGSGRYQVSDVGVMSLDTTTGVGEYIFDAWWMAVFYEVPGSTKRHLKLFDSMRVVAGGSGTTFALNGFHVPAYAVDAKLGVVAFEGDDPTPDINDTFSFNGQQLSNDLNPANNFFNSTRSWSTKNRTLTTDTPLAGVSAGADGVYDAYPISNRNDRPQLTGTPGSMSGMDLDVVDVTVAAGAKTATATANSSGDRFWLGGFLTSITTQAPDFVNTIKSARNVSRPDGTVRPGDTIEYTISTSNSGDDTSRDTVVNDKLPTQLQYVPGSLMLRSVAASDTQVPGPLTDAKGDDVGHYDAATHTLTVYLGRGATSSRGGQLKGILRAGDVAESTSISFQMKVKPDTQGKVENQAIITAGGVLGIEPVDTPSHSPDGEGPTDFEVAIVPTPVIQTPANGSLIPTARPTYSGTALPGTTVSVKVDGIEVCTATTSASGTWSCSAPVDAAPLSQGPHTVTAVASNSDGTSRPATNTFSVDAVKPATPVITSPTYGATLSVQRPTFEGTAEPNALVIVSVDGRVIGRILADSSGKWWLPTPTPLAEGPHTVSAMAQDAAGNRSEATSVPFTITASPPDTQIDLGPTTGSADRTATFTFTGIGTSIHSFDCSLNGSSFLNRCADAASKKGTYQYTNLPDGRYVFRVRARNNSGSVDLTPATWIWTVGVDSDGDGIPDNNETDHGTNPNDSDSDDDGIPDGLEDTNGNGVVNAGETDPRNPDSDGDGLPDGTEDKNHNGTVDPGETDPRTADTDGDGSPDGSEDKNHNGTVDAGETDPLNPDSDGDGIPDGIEVSGNTNPLDSDSDDDGIPDGLEDANHNGTVDPGETDPRKPDSDGDGLPDGLEDKNHNGTVDPGETDPRKPDSDGDGFPDGTEDKNHNGTVDPGETDPRKPDSDGDGLPDGVEVSGNTNPLDSDTDDDGILDGTEDKNHNGTVDPGETDPRIPDSDGDGLPDGLEDKNHNGSVDPGETDPSKVDTDGDGLPDGVEDKNHNGTVDPGETDPRNPDTDNDGQPDGVEVIGKTDPLDPDTDDDGILDGTEDTNHNGTVDPGETDPRSTDSDGDGLPDGVEDKNHDGTVDPGETDPRKPDTDGDGLPDGLEDKDHDGTVDPGETDPRKPDTDGGGVHDGAEDVNHNGTVDPGETNPLDPKDDDPNRDNDGDGIPDSIENSTGTDPTKVDTDGDGIPDGVEDKNHNGTVDPGETDPRLPDSDGDGLPDGLEDKNHNGSVDLGETDPRTADTDGDGLSDGLEDKNHNGTVDPVETDPLNPDTDGGGTPDGVEDKNHNGTVDPGETDPLNPADDNPSKDSDGDGLPDSDETAHGTDPNNSDTDGDGLSDGEEDANHNGTVDDGETDPRNRDTDGGGTSDGEEAKAHSNPLDGNDDLLLGGRGCSSSGGSPLAWLTMALLGLPWLRSRRTARPGVLGGLLGLAGVLSAPAANAQVVSPSPLSQSIDVQRYKPGPGATDILGVHGSRVDNHLGWHLGASVNYASNPLGFYNPATDRYVYELVAHQATLDVMGSLSLWNRFELGVVLPITYQSSESEAGFTPAFAEGVAGAGLGDVRLVPKLNLVSSENFGLGLVVPVLLPSAGGEAFRGGAGVSARPQLVVEWGRDKGARLVANLGANLQRQEQLRNLRTGTELMYALGAQIPFTEKLALRANLAGSYGLNYTGFGALPLEVLAALQYRFSPGLSAHVGGGPGLTRGYGTPAFRVFAGIDWHQPGERASAAPVADTTPEAAPAAASVDTDGDGIADTADKCPAKAEDKDGFEDQDGCPDRDNDKDGRPDVTDRCPNEPETANGFQDEDGCPDQAPAKDSDGDGLLDSKDRCPLQAEDKDGFQDEDGCPDPDNDQDGVPDAKDQCPNEPEVINGVKDEDGCPDQGKSKVRLESNRIVILDKVYFATARDVILPKSFSLLKQVASVLKANPQIELLRVEGHTDNQGNDASNLRLSQRRADKVRAFLVREGIAGERLDAMGFGETQPVDNNKKAAGRENNRRVEFNILKMSGQDVQKNP